MGLPLQFGYECDDCKGRFSLTSKERHSHSRAHCPLCGSFHFHKARGSHGAQPIKDLAGIKAGGKPVSLDKDKNIQATRQGSVRHQEKLLARNKLLSYPSNYREATIQNMHKKHAAKLKRQRADERARDFTPYKD